MILPEMLEAIPLPPPPPVIFFLKKNASPIVAPRSNQVIRGVGHG